MTADELRAICDDLNVTPTRLAEICGGRPGNRPSWTRAGNPHPVPPSIQAAARVLLCVASRPTAGQLAAVLDAEAGKLRRLEDAGPA